MGSGRRSKLYIVEISWGASAQIQVPALLYYIGIPLCLPRQRRLESEKRGKVEMDIPQYEMVRSDAAIVTDP